MHGYLISSVTNRNSYFPAKKCPETKNLNSLNLVPATPSYSMVCTFAIARKNLVEKRAVTKAHLEDNIKREGTKEKFEINIWQLV